MNEALGALALIFYVLLVISLSVAPVVALIWIARTLAALRRENAQMVRLLTTTATDLRVARMRERRAGHPNDPAVP